MGDAVMSECGQYRYRLDRQLAAEPQEQSNACCFITERTFPMAETELMPSMSEADIVDLHTRIAAKMLSVGLLASPQQVLGIVQTIAAWNRRPPLDENRDGRSSGIVHASDCAINYGPALRPGPCNCGAAEQGTGSASPAQADPGNRSAQLEEALKMLIDATRRALSWSDGGASPFANNDIGNCYDALEKARAVINGRGSMAAGGKSHEWTTEPHKSTPAAHQLCAGQGPPARAASHLPSPDPVRATLENWLEEPGEVSPAAWGALKQTVDDAAEKQKAEIERLREALETIADASLWDENNPNALKTIMATARTALRRHRGEKE